MGRSIRTRSEYAVWRSCQTGKHGHRQEIAGNHHVILDGGADPGSWFRYRREGRSRPSLSLGRDDGFAPAARHSRIWVALALFLRNNRWLLLLCSHGTTAGCSCSVPTERPLAALALFLRNNRYAAYPPVMLIWRATAGAAPALSITKSWPLGLREIASSMARCKGPSLSDARRGTRRSAASSWPRHM